MRDEATRHQCTVKLFNGEETSDEHSEAVPGGNIVMAVVDGPDVAVWAKEMGTIGSVAWESDGSDFAYAVLPRTPNLATLLRSEGYIVDDTEYLEAS